MSGLALLVEDLRDERNGAKDVKEKEHNNHCTRGCYPNAIAKVKQLYAIYLHI